MATVSGDYDLATDDGRFSARILASVSRKESDDKSRRILRKKLELAQQRSVGGGGHRPFGYLDDRRTVNKPEAKLIKEAARRLLAGESLRGVCADWNARGVATVTGSAWTTQTLRRSLTSPQTAGLREHRGQVIGPAQWKPILDVQSHERLRKLLLDPRRRKSPQGNARRYLLTGFLYCALCEERLVARPRADHARNYVCSSGVGFSGCGKLRALSEPLEDHVRDAVFYALDSPALAETIAAVTGQDSLQQELFDCLRADEDALERLAADFYTDRILTRPEFLAARASLTASIAESKRKLSGQGAVSLLSQLPTGAALEKAWAESNLERRRAIVAAVIERIVVHPAIRGRNRFDPDRLQIVWRA